jgi:hypothetical protein
VRQRAPPRRPRAARPEGWRPPLWGLWSTRCGRKGDQLSGGAPRPLTKRHRR